jgi:hypothetical protein
MRLIYLIIAVLILPLVALGDEYTLGEYRRYGSYNYLELARTSNGGASFEFIMSLIKPSHDKFSIRIMSPLTQEAKIEMLDFYQKNIPVELNSALNSSGDLHNPALKPLMDKFSAALKRTTLFSKYEAILKTKGYRVLKIGFEKFEFISGDLWVAEINIECQRVD